MIGAALLVALFNLQPLFSQTAENTPQAVSLTIKSLGFKYPDIVYEQYKAESGLGTSNLARNANNLFGMKMYQSRGGLAVGVTKSGFAIYNSFREAITDRLLLEYFSGWHKLSRAEYLKVMRNIYCKNCKNYLEM